MYAFTTNYQPNEWMAFKHRLDQRAVAFRFRMGFTSFLVIDRGRLRARKESLSVFVCWTVRILRS